jgi:hypothetical protein
MKKTVKKKFHLDKRAAKLAAVPGDDDDLLTTAQVAEWFGVSEQWLEIGRSKGYGPSFERLAPNIIRYSRGKARKWLNGRNYTCTSEYR